MIYWPWGSANPEPTSSGDLGWGELVDLQWLQTPSFSTLLLLSCPPAGFACFTLCAPALCPWVVCLQAFGGHPPFYPPPDMSSVGAKGSFVLRFRQVLEGSEPLAEASLRGGGRAAAGEAHARLPQLQVPAAAEEAGQEDLQAGGPGIFAGQPDAGPKRRAGEADLRPGRWGERGTG